jgi:hypothetical protein
LSVFHFRHHGAGTVEKEKESHRVVVGKLLSSTARESSRYTYIALSSTFGARGTQTVNFRVCSLDIVILNGDAGRKGSELVTVYIPLRK